jgi:tetrahydromethanopterin S-methyltransferase subunit F
MYERLLILQPDQAQASRLGEGRVTLANLAGLFAGLVVAIVLIAVVTASV